MIASGSFALELACPAIVLEIAGRFADGVRRRNWCGFDLPHREGLGIWNLGVAVLEIGGFGTEDDIIGRRARAAVGRGVVVVRIRIRRLALVLEIDGPAGGGAAPIASITQAPEIISVSNLR